MGRLQACTAATAGRAACLADLIVSTRCRRQRQQCYCCGSSSHTSASTAAQHAASPPAPQQRWRAAAPRLLQRLGLPPDAEPEALWQQLAAGPPDQQQAALQQHLDADAARMLLAAAAASSCGCQAAANRLAPLIRAVVASPPLLQQFELADFRLLLQLCAAARYVPCKEQLAALIYADTGGLERLYTTAAAAELVELLADLAAALGSHTQLYVELQQAQAQQQVQAQQAQAQQVQAQQVQAQQVQAQQAQAQQVQAQQVQAQAASQSLPSADKPEAADAVQQQGVELAALQAAFQAGAQALADIRGDRLLAGELSAVGGYWLLRKLLPQLQPSAAAASGNAQQQAGAGGSSDADASSGNMAVALRGLLALRGLGYQALDAEEADVLLALLTAYLPAWSCSQVAAALVATLPCLGDVAPSDGSALAVLFAAAGAAAPGMAPREAGQLLVVLEQLPGYAPDAQVAQALLDAALVPPMMLSARQLYALLSAAGQLGAAPRAAQLALVQAALAS